MHSASVRWNSSSSSYFSLIPRVNILTVTGIWQGVRRIKDRLKLKEKRKINRKERKSNCGRLGFFQANTFTIKVPIRERELTTCGGRAFHWLVWGRRNGEYCLPCMLSCQRSVWGYLPCYPVKGLCVACTL